MTVWNTGLMVAGLVVMLVRPTAAVTTYSPPVRSSEGDNLGCVVQNLSTQSVEVESQMIGSLGAIVDTSTVTVPARNVRQLADTSTSVFGAYCVFRFEADPSLVRGFIGLEDAGGSNTRLLFPATEIDTLPDEFEARTASPPVRNSEGDNLGCFVQNLSDAPVQVVSELESSLGEVVDSTTVTVPAGQALQLADSSTAVFGGFCTFRFSGSPSRVRGFINLEDAGGSNTRLLYPASSLAPAAPPLTATPTATTPLLTPTPTQPTGGTPGACCGDCNGNTLVSIDELVTAVNRALLGCEEP